MGYIIILVIIILIVFIYHYDEPWTRYNSHAEHGNNRGIPGHAPNAHLVKCSEGV